MPKNGDKEYAEHILSLILYPDSSSWSSSSAIPKIESAYNETADIIWILHDKDKDEKPHYHLFIRFKGNISRNKFQRDFEITGSTCFNLQEFREKFQLNPAISKEMVYSWDGCVRYTAHRTEDSKFKYQYPLNEIHANFDISKYFKELDPQESDQIVFRRIYRQAVKEHYNFTQLYEYVDRNNYFKVWHKFHWELDRLLSAYQWYYQPTVFHKVEDSEEVQF